MADKIVIQAFRPVAPRIIVLHKPASFGACSTQLPLYERARVRQLCVLPTVVLPRSTLQLLWRSAGHWRPRAELRAIRARAPAPAPPEGSNPTAVCGEGPRPPGAANPGGRRRPTACPTPGSLSARKPMTSLCAATRLGRPVMLSHRMEQAEVFLVAEKRVDRHTFCRREDQGENNSKRATIVVVRPVEQVRPAHETVSECRPFGCSVQRISHVGGLL